MAGILIERGGYLREILRLLGAAAWDCWWLITGLECYQTQGWPGCEKWNRETPLLSNEDLIRDIEARDMQFVWGIFSAIPAQYTREEIFAHPLPDFLDEDGRSRCLRQHLLPQHPLAFLEIFSEDSSTITVSAPRAEILRPLYGLDCWTEDAEEQNRRFLVLETVTAQLVRKRGYGAMDAHTRRNLNGLLWRGLYHHRPERPVCEDEIEAAYLRLWKGETSWLKMK